MASIRYLVLLLVLSLGIPSAAQTIEPNPDLSDLWAQVHDQADDFSLGCVPLIYPSGAALYNADEPFALASVAKLLIFIEFAQRVNAGQINSDQLVSLAAINHYNLPRTNGGAHEQFLRSYPENTVHITLWDVATQGMIRYSSNAATDYLLHLMQPIDWEALYTRLNLTSTSYPHSLAAVALVMENHETGQPRLSQISDLSIATGEEMLRKYVEDPEWRADELAYREDRRRVFPSWEVQQAVLQQVTATGTVNDFIKVLTAIYSTTDTTLNSGTKRLVRIALRWQNNDLIRKTYTEYGSKLGFYSGGTLTLVAYGNAYSGLEVISVVFFRNIPRERYFDLLREDSIGLLAHRLNLTTCAGILDEIGG